MVLQAHQRNSLIQSFLVSVFVAVASLSRVTIGFQLSRPPPCRDVTSRRPPTKQYTLAIGKATSPTTKWEVYIDQSKPALDKGASATLDAFLGLAPADSVTVIPAILTRTKSKAPAIRCIVSSTNDGAVKSLDVGNVDSVDKVFRILHKHMQVKGVSIDTCECLKWKYKGNGYLEAGKVAHAIDSYDKALAYGVREQEGIILFMRADAYMQRANQHRQKLNDIVNKLTSMVPEPEVLQSVFVEAARVTPTSSSVALANSVFRRVLSDTAHQEVQFRQTQYRHGLYQYALLQAAQDSLRATELLPMHADSWRRAGDILSELWIKGSAQYYVRAMELDPSLADTLLPLTQRLAKQQELLDNARAYGWSEETLRLALDVAR